MRTRRLLQGLLVTTIVHAGCGDDGPSEPPLQVPYGETTFVILVNPVINGPTGVALPPPGPVRTGVDVSWGSGSAVRTDAAGVAVLSNLTAGTDSLSVRGGGLWGALNASIANRELYEVAVALTGNGATTMVTLRYPFGGTVVEVSPSTSVTAVNAQLARSNIVVLMRGGTYRGDLRFTGSNVTLFGAGLRGGEVTIDGSVVIEGSGNRIRGARITGNLSVSGSGAGISFSRVAGTTTISGSGAILLNNAFCGGTSVIGSNAIALGNAGLSPIPASAGC